MVQEGISKSGRITTLTSQGSSLVRLGRNFVRNPSSARIERCCQNTRDQYVMHRSRDAQLGQRVPKSGEVNDYECPEDAFPSRFGRCGEDFARKGFAIDNHGTPKLLQGHLFLELVQVDAAEMVKVEGVAILQSTSRMSTF